MPMPVSSIVNCGDLVAIADPQGDVAGVGELDRIGKKIDQDLPQAILVGVHDDRQVLRTGYSGTRCPCGRLQAEHVHQLVEEIGGVHLVAVEMKASGFDLRNVEQAVDQAGQMLGAAANDLDGVDPP